MPPDTAAPLFERDMGTIARLSGFLIAPPRIRTLVVVWIAEIAGFSLWGYGGLPGFRFPLVLLAFSAAGCLLARPLARWAGGDIVFANALFLTAAGLFALAVLLKTGVAPAPALGVVLWLDVAVFATLAGLRILRAVVPASAPLLAAFFTWKLIAPASVPDPVPCLAVLGLAWALGGAYFAVIGRPLRRIDLDLLDLFSRILGDYAGCEPSRANPFAGVGIEADVRCQTVVIERPGSRDAILVPAIHPGPIGSLGGDLPARLRESLSGVFGHVVFLHTYVDHTRNPADRDSAVAGIKAAALRAVAASTRSGPSTAFQRAAKGRATASGLKIGGLPLIFTTFAPGRTDDIAPDSAARILSGPAGKAVLVDGHNSSGAGKEREKSIEEGDPRLTDLAEAIAELRRAQDAEPDLDLAIGIAERSVPVHGFGSCCGLAFRAGFQTSAVIVLEANNLPAGLREEILEDLERLGIEAGEVVTTDSHPADVPSMTEKGRTGTGRALLLGVAREAAQSAVEDLRPARIRYGDERIPLKIWGPLFDRIVRAVPRTARLALAAGAGTILVFWVVSSWLMRALG